MKIELSKPIQYKDTELKEIEFALEDMTGKDLLKVESDLRAGGVNVPAWEYSRAFLIQVAASASHLPVEVLRGASVKDFTRIINEVLTFLAG